MPSACAAAQGFGYLVGYVNDPLDRQHALLFEDVAQLLAVDELHREVEQPVFGFAEIINSDCVRAVYAAGVLWLRG